MFEQWWVVLAFLPVLLVLMVLSAFFSASEAAFFSLPGSMRRKLSKNKPAERWILDLLENPNRLLTAVLFWNLTINMAFFAVASIAAQRLDQDDPSGTNNAIFTATTLFAIILCGELIPKSLGVLNPSTISRWVSFPLMVLVRLLDPITPVFRFINETSRRLIWPGLRPESYLEIKDLERAISLSTTDSNLVEQEQNVLQNLLQMSEIRVEEWMRPRSDFSTLPAPVSMRDLIQEGALGEYLLVTDPAGNEILGTIALRSLAWRDASDLANQQQAVLFVPWCATVAATLERFLNEDRRVAVVVNEYGEPIGVITLEDAMEAIFDLQHGSTDRSLALPNVYSVSETQWNVTGTTSLRRLERALGMRLPESRSLTVAGVIQEQLHRLVQPGDQCDWDWVHLEVIQSPRRGEMLVTLTIKSPPEDKS